MEDLTKVTLPSGAKLEITPAEFAIARKTYQVIAREGEGIAIKGKEESYDVIKRVLLRAISSEAIEAQIWECMSRVTYNGIKVTKDTFEPLKARGDYLTVLFEVAVVNVRPFMEPLLARFTGIEGLGDVFQWLQSEMAPTKTG